MKTVWVVGERNDRWSTNEIAIFARKDKAWKCFENLINEHANEDEYVYEELSDRASWMDHGHYCCIEIWKQELL